jgi:isoquinoline 1-oxidoreductase alpha subunit
MNFSVNNTPYNLEVEGDMPILWVLRDILELTGTKFGCGIAQCGACTVHLNGQAIRSCVTPISSAEEMNITTIEGLSETENALQKAWLMEDVPQCGYCQSGQIMAAASLLKEKPEPTDEDIDRAMSGNICRCGTYVRIRKAIHLASKIQKEVEVAK